MRRDEADCRKMQLSLEGVNFEMPIIYASEDVTRQLDIWVWDLGERSNVEIWKLSGS